MSIYLGLGSHFVQDERPDSHVGLANGSQERQSGEVGDDGRHCRRPADPRITMDEDGQGHGVVLNPGDEPRQERGMISVEIDPSIGDVSVLLVDVANLLVEIVKGRPDKVVKLEPKDGKEPVAENRRGVPRIHDRDENGSGGGNDRLDLLLRTEVDRDDHGASPSDSSSGAGAASGAIR